jgi:hypothetical protein
MQGGDPSISPKILKGFVSSFERFMQKGTLGSWKFKRENLKTKIVPTHQRLYELGKHS